MREIKILALVVIIIGVIYWGVEPLAHSVMHPKAQKTDFAFNDLNMINLQSVSHDTADIAAGKELFLNNCASCHGIKSQNIPAPFDHAGSIDAFGVVAPDLGDVGGILDAHFLANFIKDPVKASLLSHKFKISCEGEACDKQNEGKLDYPMNAFNGILSDDEIGHIVSFLVSIAPKDLSAKDIFLNTCTRCHSIKYDGVASDTPEDSLEKYLGSKAPDLSIVIRAKEREYLDTFINNPQHALAGTSMPRLGLNQEAQEKVINYLESVGDSKKQERDSLGWKITALAYAWKRKIWKDVH